MIRFWSVYKESHITDSFISPSLYFDCQKNYAQNEHIIPINSGEEAKTISEDEVFRVDEHESVCFECAEAEALKAKEEKREIQITHGEFAEAWSLCQWCDSLFPESELQEEHDLGYLCGHCISAISSRGEEVWLKN